MAEQRTESLKLDLDKVDQIIEKYRHDKAPYIPLMQEINDEYRYLPEEALKRVSKALNISLSELYSLATFYKCFSLTPRGEHELQVCLGTACHVRGASQILEKITRNLQVEPGKTTDDGKYTVETVNCLGACALGPLVMIDDKYFGNLTPDKIDKMLGGNHEEDK